jgi:hypothetical protein
MSLCMDEDYAQTSAHGKSALRANICMTKQPENGHVPRMPERSPESQAAYDPDKIRAAIRTVMAKENLKVRPWAEKSGVSDGSLRAFLHGEADAPHIDTFVRLAWGAGVPVGALLGEPAPVDGRSEADAIAAIPAQELHEVLLGVLREILETRREVSETVRNLNLRRDALDLALENLTRFLEGARERRGG